MARGKHSRWAPCSTETSAGFDLYMQKGAYIQVDREATRIGSPTKNDDQPVEERKEFHDQWKRWMLLYSENWGLDNNTHIDLDSWNLEGKGA